MVTRFGYHRDGDWVVEPRFEKAMSFHHGLAAVMDGGRWGYIDSTGDWVIEPRYFHAGAFLDGFFACVERERNRPFHIDRRGEPAFVRREPTSDGLFAACAEGFHAWDAKWGYREAETGAWAIDPQYAQAGPFFGEYATAMSWIPEVGGRWGLIDRSGAWVVEPAYILANGSEARGGILAIKSEDDAFHWGIVHPTEGLVVPFGKTQLRPDLSRQTGFTLARTAADEALVVKKGKVKARASQDVDRFPFRFYGVGIGDSERQIAYRVRFAPGTDPKPAVTALRRCFPHCAVEAEGGFAAVWLDEVYEQGASIVEETAIAGLRALHTEHPIAEVVNLTVSDVAESDWDRWSRRQQEHPDEGPSFGEPTPA